jgi:hypothetical protein
VGMIQKWTHYAGLTGSADGPRGISKEVPGAKAKAALKKHATIINALLATLESEQGFDLGGELGSSGAAPSSMPYAPFYGHGSDALPFASPKGAPSLGKLDSTGSEAYEEQDFLPADEMDDAEEDGGGGSAADLMQFVDLSQLEAMIAEEASGTGEAAGGGGVAVSELMDMLDQHDQLELGMAPPRSYLPNAQLPPSSSHGMQPLPLQALPSHGMQPLPLQALPSLPLDLPGLLPRTDSAEEHGSHAGSVSADSMGETASTISSLASVLEPKHRNTMGRKDWSAQEDQTILEEVAKVGQKWRLIAAKLPGRSDDAVRNRWKRLTGAHSHTSAAAAQVADALGLTSDGGPPKPKASKPRAPKADGAAKTERLAWSVAEDDLIVKSVQEMGLKWGKISELLPGRTAHAIRNRFHRLQTLQAEQKAAANQPAPAKPTSWTWQTLG